MTAPRGVTTRVWRPYDDAPLVTREMVSGLAACDTGTRDRLLSYLGALVAHRSAPVHTAVAFNAVYFGYDITAGGYAGGPLDIDDFPPVALGDHVDALPVGAMINIRTSSDLLPAEIVYKEGAHQDLGPYGETPAWLSGAPAGAEGPGRLASAGTTGPSLRERLVFDTTAFGQGLAPTSHRLQRLRRQGRTDELGHLVVESRYTAADAELGDADYYAQYLVTRGRDQLTSALAPAPLPSLIAPGGGVEQLLAAVQGLMGTVRQALALLDSARVWGEYAFTRDSMARRLVGVGALGRDDLGRLAESTANHALPQAVRRFRAVEPKPVYTAIGQVLRSRAEWRDEIHGVAYPLAVCHANSVLADYARGEHDEVTGLLRSGVRLALDDRWQGGGVWRAEYVGQGTGAPVAGRVDDPLGLGWAESVPRQVPERASASDPEPAASSLMTADAGHGDEQEPRPQGQEEASAATPWPDDSELGSPFVLSVNDSQVEWAQPLRLAHIRGGYLLLPRDIVTEFRVLDAAAGPVEVRLQHAGLELPPATARQHTSLVGHGQDVRLTGLVWPGEFFPGIWLSFTWQRGSRVIHARTTPLAGPVTIDGDLLAHRFDSRVLTRDGADGLWGDGGSRGDRSDDHVLMVAVRRLGLLDQYGRAMLGRVDVPAAVRAVMGRGVLSERRTEVALAGLLVTRRLTTVQGSRGVDGRTYHPPRRGQSLEELVCYTPRRVEVRGGRTAADPTPEGPDLGQPIQEHDVAGFLRRIGHLGHQATEEQRELYRADYRKYRLTGSPELPAGFTYVRPHTRGH